MSEDLRKRVESLEAQVRELSDFVAKLRGVLGGGSADAATDREMDHPQYGDPKVAAQPRDWKGEPMKGRKFSECPPEFLEELAAMYDYFERKNRESGAKTSNGKLKADFDKRLARFARGWAARLRSGWQPPERPAPLGMNGASPFGGGGGGFGASRPTGGPFGASRPMPPAPPPEQTQERSVGGEPGEDDDIDFPFGANARPAPAKTSVPLEDEDDEEPPLQVGGGW